MRTQRQYSTFVWQAAFLYFGNRYATKSEFPEIAKNFFYATYSSRGEERDLPTDKFHRSAQAAVRGTNKRGIRRTWPREASLLCACSTERSFRKTSCSI